MLSKNLETVIKDYTKRRFVFIPGDRMKAILVELGASLVDLESLPLAGESLLDDPTLQYRKSRNGRFCFDFGKAEAWRTEHQGFVLSKDEDFHRHDSGQVRRFRAIDDQVQLNSAFQALLQFKAAIFKNVSVERRHGLNYDVDRFISTVFHLRTVTDRDLLGEPAAEGAHSDGVDHTMTTFLGSSNMSDESAISQIHLNDQKTGASYSEVDDKFIVGSEQHLRTFDTLLIADSERKHTVSPVICKDPQRPATRDMLILFSRQPYAIEHAASEYDSVAEHPDLPLRFPLIPF